MDSSMCVCIFLSTGATEYMLGDDPYMLVIFLIVFENKVKHLTVRKTSATFTAFKF
jgi:hypothetical protein